MERVAMVGVHMHEVLASPVLNKQPVNLCLAQVGEGSSKLLVACKKGRP